MKHLFSIIAALFLAITTVIAENSQRIQVLQYVPNRKEGILSPNIHKRPLSGVKLEISGAKPINFNDKGYATVHFEHLVPGDHVNIKHISKPGFQLFSLHTKETWYVAEGSNQPTRIILMVSDEDMEWIKAQWQGILLSSQGSRFRFYTTHDHLYCADMSDQLPLNREVLPHIVAGDFEKAINIYNEANLLEEYRSNINNDPKILHEIEDKLLFLTIIMEINPKRNENNEFNFIQSLYEYCPTIPWLLDFYPSLSHSLQKYDEFSAFSDKWLSRPGVAAADRAYLALIKAHNARSSEDTNHNIELINDALHIYDSIAVATHDPQIYAYPRGFLYNMLGSMYDKLNQPELMDHNFSLARKYFNISEQEEPIHKFITFAFIAVQAEGYWRHQYRVEIVDELIEQAKRVSDLCKDTNEQFVRAYLTTVIRFANIDYMRGSYEHVYKALKDVEDREIRLFNRNPQAQAEHYAQYLMLKAKTCAHLRKWEDANDALNKCYAAYDVVDRLNPGAHKKVYLDIHLLHAAVRLQLEQHHWVRTDLDRAKVLTDEVYANNDSIRKGYHTQIEALRKYVKPAMVSVEQARQRFNPDRFEFAVITDTHNFGRSADVRDADKNIEEFVKYCNEHPALQVAVHGGDFINAYDTDHDRALWCLTKARAQFIGLQIPFYTVKGNHDCNGKQWIENRRDNSQIVTDREYFDLFSPFAVTNPLSSPEGIVYNNNEPTRNYYYRDFDTQRVRLILLNAYHRDSLETLGYDGEQLRWFAEEALDFSQKSDPEEWGFIIIGHLLPQGTKRAIGRLLIAYNDGSEEYAEPGNSAPFVWSRAKHKHAQMIAFIGGHQHIDTYSNGTGYNHITMTRGFATGNEVECSPLCFSHFIIDTRNHTIEEKRIGNGRSRIYTYGKKSAQIAPMRPFNSADGLGTYTAGPGEKGRIVYVTNLNNDGEGSLRWAVEQKGARIVVFKKGGTIRLQSPLIINNDSIGIAGQTAPKPVVLSGAPVVIKASEVIMRYLTINPGIVDANAICDDHFGQKNIILDHLTIGSTLGSGIAFRYTEDATVQRCRIAGSLSPNNAALVAGGFKVTYYNNFIEGSNRSIMIPDEFGCNRWIHIVRNVITDWREYSIYGGNNQGEVSITDNYYIPSSRTEHLKILDVSQDGTGRYYVNNNVIMGSERQPQRNMVIDHTGVPWRMPLQIDSLEWNKIPMIARPNERQHSFAASCLTIAAFHYKEIAGTPTPQETYEYVSEAAGNVLKNRKRQVYKDKDGNGYPDPYEKLTDWIQSIVTEP